MEDRKGDGSIYLCFYLFKTEKGTVLFICAKITDALGNVTTMSYDEKGNLIKAISPQQSAISISYNSFGQPISITDALNNTTTFEYDSYGNLSEIQNPQSEITRMEYDAISRVIKTTDPKGKTTQYGYDNMNRIKEVIDALNGRTMFTYDKNGNLTYVTDAENQTISYTYNVRDKIASMTDQLAKTETYSYDLNDNLTSITDRKNQKTTYSYDKMNRISKAQYADNAYTDYIYDAVGRLITVNDSTSGLISYVYSNNGCAGGCSGGFADKVIQETTSLSTINYEYDAIGRRTKMTVAGQDAVNYAYDSNSRLTQLTQGTKTFNFNYDAIGRRTSVSLPNGVTTNYSYDNASRLLNIDHLNPLNSILEKISYSYDATGNRLSIDRQSASVKFPDAVSNASYNSANQMLSFNDASTSSARTMTYDANGNMETVTNSCGTTTYTWDARNRLAAINGFNSDCSQLTAAFKYDALGRRIQKTITHTDTVTDTMYLYNGMDIMQEIENGTVTANYIRTLNIDEPLARIKSDGTVRYYQQDALGSVIALTDENGNIRTQYSYDPFGNVTVSGEASDNPFQYTGRENDNTGLYYYRARYYSPELQRFISEDPIRFGGGINFYVYVGNNPVNFVDPLGLAYGTKDCSYYKKMCEEHGGIYYCHIVQFFCENWPDTPGNWDECVRQCLQDFDAKFCHDPCNKYDSYTCKFADSHAYCFTACGSNPNDKPGWLK